MEVPIDIVKGRCSENVHDYVMLELFAHFDTSCNAIYAARLGFFGRYSFDDTAARGVLH
jgi:hypothetical protein